MLMEKNEIQNAFEFVLEPGDMTRYHFLVAIAGDGGMETEVFISTLNNVRFDCYRFPLSNIVEFMKRFPAFFFVPEGSYNDYVKGSGVLKDHFVKYVCEKTGCCSMTAVAAMFCFFHSASGFLKQFLSGNKRREEIS